MIKFENVSKKYPNSPRNAIDRVSFEIPKGEFAFVIGSTGAGKTTLTRLILGIEKADSGTIRIDGTEVSRLKRNEIPYYRRKIGMVFQDCKLLNYKTVGENVAYAMEVVGTPKRNIDHMLPQILSVVGLSDKIDRYPNSLSGGEKQKVAMARAMANNPPILIADEPTGNLDPDTAWDIIRILERFNRMGTTVMVVTHANRIVDASGRRVLRLADGKLVRDESKGLYGVIEGL